jgi:protein phosphatase
VRLARATALTRDHTVAAEQTRLGPITAGEAARAETRNPLSRSVGNDLFVDVAASEHPVLAGDILVQCSNGLHRSVSGADIASVVSRIHDLKAAAERLVALANERDGTDNISIQLIRVKSTERCLLRRRA